MNKIVVILFFLTIGFMSCATSEKPNSKVKITETFFEALNTSNS